jgi:hypothetical protein
MAAETGKFDEAVANLPRGRREYPPVQTCLRSLKQSVFRVVTSAKSKGNEYGGATGFHLLR